MPIPELRSIVKSTIVRYLACSSETSRDYLVMLEYFRDCGQGFFSEEILLKILEEFPQELTDDLFIVLSPPHLRHLQLTSCRRLSCSGLEKVISKCQHLQSLDFSECLHLLHPTVFCCLKDKASNLVSISLENSEVVSDDIVQVVLMCCPGLKHVNLSSCQNITDKAFSFPQNQRTNWDSASIPSHAKNQPGRNLTSVDVSGCSSLSTMGVRHLLDLCGPCLTEINLSWTSVGCTALLHLAGLSLTEAARIIQDTDPACPVLLEILPKGDQEHGTAMKKLGQHHGESKEWSEDSVILASRADLSPADCVQESLQTSVNQELPHDSFDCHSDEQEFNTLHISFLEKKCDKKSVNGDEVLPTCGDHSVLHDAEALSNHDENSFIINTSASLPVPRSTLQTEADPVIEVPWRDRHSDSMLNVVASTSQNTSAVEELLDANEITLEMEAMAMCSQLLELDNDGPESYTQSTVSSFSTALSSLSCALGNMISDDESSLNDQCDGTMPSVLTTSSVGCYAPFLYDNVSNEGLDAVMYSNDSGLTYSKDASSGKELKSFCSNDSTQTVVTTQTVTSPNHGIAVGSPVAGSFSCNEQFGAGETLLLKCTQDKQYSYPKDAPSSSLLWSSETDSADGSKRCSCSGHRGFIEGCNSNGMSTGKLSRTENCTGISGISSANETDQQEISTNSEDSGYSSGNTRILSTQQWNAVPEGYGHMKVQSHVLSDKGFSRESNTAVCSCQNTSNRETIIENNESSVTHLCEEKMKSKYNKSRGNALTVDNLVAAQMYQPQICSLDISNIYYHSKPLGIACLKIFLKANKCLKKFSISWCEFDDDMLKYLLKNETQLESLSLVDCESVSNLSLISVPVHCPKITSVDLKGVCYITDHGVVPLARSNHLERLSLAEAAIGDSTLESLAHACGPTLKELDLCWCEDVTDRGLSIVANSCPALRHLGLRQCAAGQHTLNSLAASCHLITSLNIAGVDSLSDAILCNMAKNMPLLTEVDVSWNSSLTDFGIKALLLHCCGLKEAVLSGLKFITSAPFLGIIGDQKRWRLLEELWKHQKKSPSSSSRGKVSFKACDPETAKSLGDQIPFRSLTYASSLRHLTLEYSDKVNDDHLAAIVAVCRGTLFVRDYYSQPIEPHWIFR